MDKKRVLTLLVVFAAIQIAEFVMLVMVLGILMFRMPIFVDSATSEKVKSTRIKKAPTATVTPTMSPVPLTPTATLGAPAMTYPSQVLNLTNWKLTIPLGNSEKPTEIKQPELSKYVLNPWFVINPGGGVRFRAPVNAVTTSGSNYPRSELREMADSGRTNASWSSTSGKHTMIVDEAITAVPKTKKHVVGGQIHDSEDDIVVIRLEFPKLYINVDGENVYTLDENYTLGKRFNFRFVASGGQTQIYYNDSTDPIYTFAKDYSGGYFKAGAYTQSNCSKEGSSSLCTADNYGEVIIYKVDVTHE